ncbi:MAG: DUF3592 domain-containing protein [Ruthenibacterium sp.]
MVDLLLYLFAAVWLIYAAYGAYWERRVKAEGDALPARVKAHEHDGMMYYPVLGYTYKGVYHEVRYHLGSRQKYAQGQQVPIRVLAARPEKPEIEGRTNRPAYLFSAFVGLACLAAGVWLALR